MGNRGEQKAITSRLQTCTELNNKLHGDYLNRRDYDFMKSFIKWDE